MKLKQLVTALAMVATTLVATSAAATERACKNTDVTGQITQGYWKEGETYDVTASWYGPGMDLVQQPDGTMKPQTAIGKVFDMNATTFIAHLNLPFNSVVDLYNPATDKMERVKVQDDGPHVKGRDVDAPLGLAKALGFHGAGTAELEMTIVAIPDNGKCRAPKPKKTKKKGVTS